MISIALVDDDGLDAENLKTCLELALTNIFRGGGTTYSLDVFNNSLKFFDSFKDKYDIIFLDIGMKCFDGMSLAKRIRQAGSECCIVFVTNMPQFALQGYDVNAIGYILKPAKQSSVEDVIKRALPHINEKKNAVNIVIQTRTGIKAISSKSLYYVEIEGHNMIFYTVKGNYETRRKTLYEVENTLAGLNFERCNNCYLVNLEYVDFIENNVVRINGTNLTISRNRKKEFLQKYLKYTR